MPSLRHFVRPYITPYNVLICVLSIDALYLTFSSMIETGSCHVNRVISQKFDPSCQFSLIFSFIFSNINYGNYPSLILAVDFNTRNAKDGISRQGRGIHFFKPSHLESWWFKPNLVFGWVLLLNLATKRGIT